MKRLLIGTVLALFANSAFAQNPNFSTYPLAKYQPGPRLIDGSQLNSMVAEVNAITGTGTAGPLNGTNLTLSGNITVNTNKFTVTGASGNTVIAGTLASGAQTITGSEVNTSASANALTSGANGITNPGFNVDNSTTSVATGLNVKGAAAAAGLALSVLSSGTNENLTVDAKGSGTITLNGVGTGNIIMGHAVTGVSTSNTGAFTAYSGTATPAAASSVAGLVLGSAAIGVYWGTGAPSFTAPQGSLFIQTDGSTTATRLYVSKGAGSWAAVTTAS